MVLIFAYFSVELLSFSVADFSELFAGYEKINPLPVINWNFFLILQCISWVYGILCLSKKHPSLWKGVLLHSPGWPLTHGPPSHLSFPRAGITVIRKCGLFFPHWQVIRGNWGSFLGFSVSLIKMWEEIQTEAWGGFLLKLKEKYSGQTTAQRRDGGMERWKNKARTWAKLACRPVIWWGVGF